APAGKDLVRVGLMAHIPYQAVFRSVEHVVQRDGEFNHAEASTKMPAGLTDGVKKKFAQFSRQLRQLLFSHGAQICTAINGVEQGRYGPVQGDFIKHAMLEVSALVSGNRAFYWLDRCIKSTKSRIVSQSFLARVSLGLTSTVGCNLKACTIIQTQCRQLTAPHATGIERYESGLTSAAFQSSPVTE